jgi:hypothetical protein
MSDPRFPIGKYTYSAPLTDSQRAACIADIRQAPAALRAAVAGLNNVQLDTPYREGGWTVRQVAHHVPDSHLNAYVRYKLALTEDNPPIKAYDEARWAELADTRTTPVEVSLTLLDSLHTRWVELLQSLRPEDWSRQFLHPELGAVPLDKSLVIYAWHGKHHVAHITELRKRKGW